MIKRLSVSAAVLLAGLGMACAADEPAAAQNAAAQNNDQAKPMQGGKEEPGSHASGASTAVFIDGKLAVPGAPQDSQTVPGKFSERNAKLDATPIMAQPLGLTDEQRSKLVQGAASAPVSQITAKVSEILPATTPVSEFPADVKKDVPMAADWSFIRTKGKILLVRAPNMVVTGEIAAN